VAITPPPCLPLFFLAPWFRSQLMTIRLSFPTPWWLVIVCSAFEPSGGRLVRTHFSAQHCPPHLSSSGQLAEGFYTAVLLPPRHLGGQFFFFCRPFFFLLRSSLTEACGMTFFHRPPCSPVPRPVNPQHPQDVSLTHRLLLWGHPKIGSFRGNILFPPPRPKELPFYLPRHPPRPIHFFWKRGPCSLARNKTFTARVVTCGRIGAHYDPPFFFDRFY